MRPSWGRPRRRRHIGCAAAAFCSGPLGSSKPIRSYRGLPTTRPPAPARQGRDAPLPGARPGPGTGIGGGYRRHLTRRRSSNSSAIFQPTRRPMKHAGCWVSSPSPPATESGPRPCGRRSPAESPRWLDSRLAIAALDRDELDRQQINPDRHQMQTIYRACRPLPG